MASHHFNIKGLSNQQVLIARKSFGANVLDFKKENALFEAVRKLVKEPMVILLFVASIIYFISGNTAEAVFMAFAIVLVVAISLYQDSRSRNTLDKLKKITQPKCKVIRNDTIEEIIIEDVVVGDSLMVEEGTCIPADGTIVHSNDFSVNESILTGESFSVFKDSRSEDKIIYKGTVVTSGLAIATITSIGNHTKLGKIGKSLENILEEKTPLEQQINNFIKKMVVGGTTIFIIVWIINYYRSHSVLDSLLKALTLAMSILPEEIPVAFTTFMAIGAWRLMKMGVVVKQMKTVETLGSATVICTDKTGTITENKMSLAKVYALSSDQIVDPDVNLNADEKKVIRLAMFASEPIPFDPMEVALHKAYEKISELDERTLFTMIHEYPLGGQPPMMTHIYEDKKNNRIIAAKGAPEAIIQVSNLTAVEKLKMETALDELTKNGYRVLAVAEARLDGNPYPVKQQEILFECKGFVAFSDLPKKNIPTVLQDFYKAGIQVKLVTGDNAVTTATIAKQVELQGYDKSISGETLMKLSETELQNAVMSHEVFTRMFPDAKLKIIEALKVQGEIVAMIGDGVNDGPALKAAHIGIAMGEKGTEIAKEAASLILIKDDLSKLVDAVAMGRRIYSNLKKAIQYIISIHIPIILTVFIPLALGWIYPNIFSPVHVIFLELIMGPTCSIIYENEPMEKNTMLQSPRPFTTTFFNWKELATSIIQGLFITAGSLAAYQFAVQQNLSETTTRTMVFTVLISANIFLTLVNRSFYYSIFTTLGYKNNLVVLIIAITMVLSGLLLFVQPLTEFFHFSRLTLSQLSISIGTGFLCVIWYELVKWRTRVLSNGSLHP